MSLSQVATLIGINRTYLSKHFAMQGITYNAYINALRIQHFFHQRSGEGGLLPGFGADTLFNHSPVHGQTHGQDCSRSIYQKDTGH